MSLPRLHWPRARRHQLPPDADARPAEVWLARFGRNTPYAPTPDNRPAPLDCDLLPLARDADWQMSFGERAAFEGVLTQAQPRVAVEIGTAEGGSLRRLSARCRHVHSIDLDHTPVAGWVPDNVTLHTGASADVLPGVLRSLSDSGETVDLALVDGDHSYAGVRSDLQALLASRSMSRSVILLHDTMNAEVRAGIESVGLDRHPSVVYIELDFVPGYVYRRGSARDTAWGGLGLVVVDAERREAYGVAPRQDLYYEPFDAVQRMRAARDAQTGPTVTVP